MPAILKNSIKYSGFGTGDTIRSDSVICEDGESLQYKLDQTLVTNDTTGDLSELDTENKGTLVDAINEVKNSALSQEVTGDLEDLNTVIKSNLVAAINEVKNYSDHHVIGKGIQLSVVNGILQVTYETEE